MGPRRPPHPTLRKPHVHLQDPHHNSPAPLRREDTAPWFRQHLRPGLGRAMMPWSPSGCALARRGDPMSAPGASPGRQEGHAAHEWDPAQGAVVGYESCKELMGSGVFAAACTPCPLHPQFADSGRGEPHGGGQPSQRIVVVLLPLTFLFTSKGRVATSEQ